MSRRLIFVSFWEEALKEVVEFLEVKEFKDTAMLEHLKELLKGNDK